MLKKDQGRNLLLQSNKTSIHDTGSYACKTTIFILLVTSILSFIIVSFVNLNHASIQKLNYPVSSSGNVCIFEFPNTYSYLYIDLSSHTPTYHCVDHCPSGWNQFIINTSEGTELYGTSVEEMNAEIGGICWSSQKQSAMKQRGFYEEFKQKENILDQFKAILFILASSFVLSFLMILLFYCLPHSINYLASVAVASLLLGILIAALSTFQSPYKTIIIVAIAVITTVFISCVACGIQKLKQSASYTTLTLDKIKQGQTGSILLQSFVILLIFNLINFAFLILILLQYISLVSSQTQYHSNNRVFFSVEKKLWKYLLLVLQWLLTSTVIKQMYRLTLVKLGYRINRSKDSYHRCISFNDLINVFSYSLLIVFLWTPLKLIQLLKPDGAILRQNQEQTCCHKLTRASYCCCGLLINSVHRYTFNPYLILALDEEFTQIDESLKVVQEAYHSHDDRYDRSSLWVFTLLSKIYQLSNYISLIIISIFCMNLFNGKQIQLQSISVLFFYLIGAVLAVEVSHLNMNFWSCLVQVTEFIEIIRS